MFDPSGARIDLADGSSVALDSLDDDQLEATLASLTSAISRLEAARVATVAAISRRARWKHSGARSLSHFVSWRTGVTGGDAHRIAFLAERLPDAPALAQAFSDGSLSASQAACVAAVATPDNEAELVEWATVMSGTQLQRACRGLRQVAAANDTATSSEPADEPSRCRWWWDDRRRLRVDADLRADDGALFVQALDAARNQLSAERPDAADAPTGEPARVEPQIRNGEAFIRVGEAALAGRFRVGSGADRYQVIVQIDEATLRGDRPARLADSGVAVPSAAFDRIMCDTSVVAALTRGGEPLSIGRRDRDPTPAQRRAVRIRDQFRCRFPGCDTTRHVEVHHVHRWADGGCTDIHNLVSLCWHHHHALHSGDWTMEAPVGRSRIDSGDWDYRHRTGRIAYGRAPTPDSDRRWALAPPRGRPPDAPPIDPQPRFAGEPLTAWGLDVLISGLLPDAARAA